MLKADPLVGPAFVISAMRLTPIGLVGLPLAGSVFVISAMRGHNRSPVASSSGVGFNNICND